MSLISRDHTYPTPPQSGFTSQVVITILTDKEWYESFSPPHHMKKSEDMSNIQTILSHGIIEAYHKVNVKDTKDLTWSTSFKTRRTQKTSSALESLWKTLFVLYLYFVEITFRLSEFLSRWLLCWACIEHVCKKCKFVNAGFLRLFHYAISVECFGMSGMASCVLQLGQWEWQL
ncbi:hypothetical protein Tco_0250501 [Tanacetum coccineum]